MDTDDIVVDSRIWAFAVAAVLLTLLTIGIWLLFIPNGWQSLYGVAKGKIMAYLSSVKAGSKKQSETSAEEANNNG